MDMPLIQRANQYPVCKRCKCQMDTRIRRSAFVKNVLFWLPLKKYFCTSCLKGRYVMDKYNIYSNYPQ